MAKILFVEDELVLGKLVKEAMERKSHFVHWEKNGLDAIESLKKAKPDICILDVMMPGMDGFTTAKQIRQLLPHVPILFLTARSQTEDVIKGFESGGNDYLKKPFSLEELFVRIQELLRRTTGIYDKTEITGDKYQLGLFTFSPQTQMLKTDSLTFQLSHKENELLKELIHHKNSVMERKLILQKLWGEDNFFNARNMDVYITKLRKHLSHDPDISIINIRGIGYKLIHQTS